MSNSKCIAELPAIVSAKTTHSVNGTQLHPARRVVIEELPEGTFILHYASAWSFGGDTWHADRTDALHQLSFEYGATDLLWSSISGRRTVTSDQHQVANIYGTTRQGCTNIKA